MSQTSNVGIGLGNLIALYISGLVVKNTLGWVILHAIFGWLYVIYYFITR